MFRQTVSADTCLNIYFIGISAGGIEREALPAGGPAQQLIAEEPGAGDGLREPVAAALQVAGARAAARAAPLCLLPQRHGPTRTAAPAGRQDARRGPHQGRGRQAEAVLLSAKKDTQSPWSRERHL